MAEKGARIDGRYRNLLHPPRYLPPLPGGDFRNLPLEDSQHSLDLDTSVIMYDPFSI